MSALKHVLIISCEIYSCGVWSQNNKTYVTVQTQGMLCVCVNVRMLRPIWAPRFLSAPSGPAAERERVSESLSRWKSQSKGSAVPKKHHTAPLLTFWSPPRGGREATHFLNRIKTWRQAAPILLHAIDYTLVWSGVLSGTPRFWALFFGLSF